jgi:hypothetical protein
MISELFTIAMLLLMIVATALCWYHIGKNDEKIRVLKNIKSRGNVIADNADLNDSQKAAALDALLDVAKNL